MYTNIAYLGGVHEDIVDKSVRFLLPLQDIIKCIHFVFLKQSDLMVEVIISYYM